MALAGTYNIIADRGATFTRIITWKDANGALINLTGYTAKLQVRQTYTSTVADLELSTANGRIVLGGAAGTIQLTAPYTAMNFSADQYVYDLEMTSAASVVSRLVMGSFTLREEVTQ
jgi:hypothetical protein